jgi:peptidoglycan hydrolase CwlO-like protein
MLKMPQKIINIFLVFFLSIYSFTLFKFPVYSNDIPTLENEISQKEREIKEKENVLKSVENRIKEISSSNYSISQKINLLNEEISKLEEDIKKTEEEITEKIQAIGEKQAQLEKTKSLIDEILGDLYIQSRYKLFNFFLNKGNWNNLMESIFIKKSAITMLKSEVEKMGIEFSSLAESKAELDKQMEGLDIRKEGLDDAYKLLASEKAKLQAELSKQVAAKSGLSADITDLTKKVSQLQAALIAARSAGFISSGGYTGSEIGTGIGQAPAGYFGVFSIGAYTHRNGMSQWGARARADAGQQYNQILSFYYPGTTLRTDTVIIGGAVENITTNILVDGYGSLSFEDYYLLGIKEVPEDWNIEVLKAQAIAARTFAVRHTTNGRGSICTTQSCQVFNTPLKTGKWREAVLATRGMILVNGDGSPALTQYAAVHGGWVNNVGWDTQSGGGGNWFNDAWDRISGVTWFYKSWYRAGYTSSGETCGRTAWLSPVEMADMLNAYLIKNDIGLRVTPDKSRLLPSDYGKCPGRLDYGRVDKIPYSSAEMKNLLTSPINAVYSVSTALSNGSTTNVSFSTDRGVINIAGFAFKDIYNQMAPGHMRIQQQSSYAYFNVEKN